MTFIAQETSVEAGAPIELYTITIGTELPPTRYTNNNIDITVDSLLYSARAISRTKIVEERSKKGDQINVTLPGDDALVRRYVSAPPGARVELELTQFHRTDGAEEIITQFKGRILTVDFSDDNHKAILVVKGLTGALARTIPRFSYQGLCGHFHYDSRCKVSDTNPAFEKFLVVTAVSGKILTFGASPSAGSFGSDFFQAGFIEFEGDFRKVTEQGGVGDNDLTLMLPFTTSPINATVRVLAGCQLRIAADCRDKYSNVLNYGGWPYVPLLNLFEKGID